MNEIERFVIDNFKDENKDNEEYMHLSDEEILKINPVTPYDYVYYSEKVILELNKKITDCLNSIEYMKNNYQKDYMLRRENEENLNEEKKELIYLKEQLKYYTDIRNENLEKIDNEHTK